MTACLVKHGGMKVSRAVGGVGVGSATGGRPAGAIRPSFSRPGGSHADAATLSVAGWRRRIPMISATTAGASTDR